MSHLERQIILYKRLPLNQPIKQALAKAYILAETLAREHGSPNDRANLHLRLLLVVQLSFVKFLKYFTKKDASPQVSATVIVRLDQLPGQCHLQLGRVTGPFRNFLVPVLGAYVHTF